MNKRLLTYLHIWSPHFNCGH